MCNRHIALDARDQIVQTAELRTTNNVLAKLDRNENGFAPKLRAKLLDESTRDGDPMEVCVLTLDAEKSSSNKSTANFYF